MSDVRIEPQLRDLLSFGPKFALSRKVDSQVLKEVEAGLERGSFALRWKVDIDNRRAELPRAEHQPTEDHPATDNDPPTAPTTSTTGSDEPPRAPSPTEVAGSQLQDSDPDRSSRKVSLRPRFPDGDCSQAPPGSRPLAVREGLRADQEEGSRRV